MDATRLLTLVFESLLGDSENRKQIKNMLQSLLVSGASEPFEEELEWPEVIVSADTELLSEMRDGEKISWLRKNWYITVVVANNPGVVATLETIKTALATMDSKEFLIGVQVAQLGGRGLTYLTGDLNA